MTSRRVYVSAAVLLLALSVLVLTRSVPSKTAQSADISVINKTRAFQVIGARQGDDGLSLSLKNNSAQTVTAFVITVGSNFRITEDFITSEIPDKVGIKSQKTFEKTYPIPAASLSGPVTLQAVVFDDKSGDGDPLMFEDVRDNHLGQAVQLKRFFKVLDKHINALLPPNPDNLRRDLESALDGSELGGKMISNRLLLCIVLLVFLQPTSSAERWQKSSEEPIKDSSVVVIGGVSETFDLVRPDKLTVSARTLPDGQEIAELPQPSEYRAGTIYRFRIDEVVKGNKTIRSGQIITVLIPGPVNVSHRVVLSAERKYLLQLSSLADAEKYKGTVVMDLSQPSGAKQPFDSHNVFTPLKHFYNAVPVTEGTKELIKRIRREAKKK